MYFFFKNYIFKRGVILQYKKKSEFVNTIYIEFSKTRFSMLKTIEIQVINGYSKRHLNEARRPICLIVTFLTHDALFGVNTYHASDPLLYVF